jgi:outer membrane lipoprotein SlyB
LLSDGKLLLVALSFSLVFSLGCAQQRPVLYPNAQLKTVGQERAEGDINECIRLASEQGAQGNSGDKVAKDTVEGGAVGGAVGAGVGAVVSSVGRGAAAGAAGGAAGALTRGLFRASEPDPVFRGFVDRCLRDRGYEPIGWR